MQVGSPRFFMTGGLVLAPCSSFWRAACSTNGCATFRFSTTTFPSGCSWASWAAGICLRYFDKTEIAQVKIFIMGLTHFTPVTTAGINALLFTHLTLVCVLLDLLPLLQAGAHAGRVFQPHAQPGQQFAPGAAFNPWNPPKQFFTYAEYEDTYRDAMAEAGLPLEKQPDKAAE